MIEKLKGDHHRHLTWRCPNILGPGKVFCHITQETKRTPIPLGNWVHTCQPGDEIWVKDEQTEPLQPVWTGPYTVVLVIPTAVKVIGVTPWIHHTTVKKAGASCDEDTWKTVQDPQIPSRSGSKDNSPHPQRTLNPALVTLEADQSMHGRSLRILQLSPAMLWQLVGQCMAET